MERLLCSEREGSVWPSVALNCFKPQINANERKFLKKFPVRLRFGEASIEAVYDARESVSVWSEGTVALNQSPARKWTSLSSSLWVDNDTMYSR